MPNKMNKRAVSPLIATVLLIAFAVALGAVVMNWGQSYVKETADDVRLKSDKDIKCSTDIGIDIYSPSGIPRLCYGGEGTSGYLSFTLVNEGTEDIESISLTVEGTLDIYNNRSINGSSIPIGDAKKFNITYDYTDNGPVSSIRIVPEILVGGQTTACGGRALERPVSRITNCTSS